MRTEDGSIIYTCLSGDTEAFGILVDKYKASIYAYTYSKIRSLEDAEDVTQEVFLQAYRNLRSLRHWESFAFWLHRIARNLCNKWIRARSRRPDDAFIEDQDPQVLEKHSLNAYRDDRTDEALHEALDSLSETYREVLMLYYFGGMTIKDISKAVGASPDAIGKRLSRARSQLREEMIAMMDTAFDGQRLQASFTFRVVEAVKRIKINPMPRMAGLPWGLSLAAGIIVTVLSLNPHVSMTSDTAMPAGSPLSAEAKALKTGEMAVDVLKASEISIIASKQGSDNGAKPQNTFSPAPQKDEGGKWTEKTGMLTPRYGLSTSVLDGIIYAIGGGRGFPGPGLESVEAYNPADDEWVKKDDMLAPRCAFSTSVVDGIIYAIGGTSDGDIAISTVEAYDPAKDTWTPKADMPTARVLLSTSVVDGIIYAFGGASRVMGAKLATVEAYNPAMDIWEKKTDMPMARGNLATSVVDGIIYAIGGDAGGEYLPNVEAYDPMADKWMQKEDMPTARNALSSSVVDGIIYVIGGNTGEGDGIRIATVEAYDPAKDTWTKKADMPTARGWLSTSVVNGYVYAIGGWSQVAPKGPTNVLEEFDPGTPPGGKAVEPTGKLPTKWGEVKSE